MCAHQIRNTDAPRQVDAAIGIPQRPRWYKPPDLWSSRTTGSAPHLVRA